MNYNSHAATPTLATATADYPGWLEKKMDFDSLGEIIATRCLHYVDESNNRRTVSVLIGKPLQFHDSTDYHCPFQVIGIGSQQTLFARGQDSVQALQSALFLVGANLKNL